MSGRKKQLFYTRTSAGEKSWQLLIEHLKDLVGEVRKRIAGLVLTIKVEEQGR